MGYSQTQKYLVSIPWVELSEYIRQCSDRLPALLLADSEGDSSGERLWGQGLSPPVLLPRLEQVGSVGPGGPDDAITCMDTWRVGVLGTVRTHGGWRVLGTVWTHGGLGGAQWLRIGHHEDIFVLAGYESLLMFLRISKCHKLFPRCSVVFLNSKKNNPPTWRPEGCHQRPL